jgi:predicted GTPase
MADVLVINKVDTADPENVETVKINIASVNPSAGVVAAEKFGASEIVDPRPWITGTIAETFETYPDIGKLLPAMGYGEQQIKDLESTINAADCDAVLIGTPIDLRKVLHIEKPSVRVTYDLKEIGKPTVAEVLTPLMK